MPVCARLVLLLGFLLTALLSQSGLAVDTGSRPAISVAQNTPPAVTKESNGSNQSNGSVALVILGLVDSLHQDVRDAIDKQLGNVNVVYAEIGEVQEPSYQWPKVDKVIATGVAACTRAVEVRLSVPVVCSFLTSERFREIVQKLSESERKNLTAIVIDQPVSRQAAIARKVYPALSRFAVLSQQEEPQSRFASADVRVSTYRSGRALAPQLSEVTTSQDALIATPESAIYNRSTLRTVLLTAYGYGKPVVGYSRAYVKAGALITGYSTPDQVFRQIAEMSQGQTEAGASPSLVVSPKYFSVVDNPSVARSLGLFKLFEFKADESYEDKDFQS